MGVISPTSSYLAQLVGNRNAPAAGTVSQALRTCTGASSTFLTRERLLARYPEAETFIRIRRELEPAGIFLNDHLRLLFA